MHGEDYTCLGFLFGKKSRVAYISDISRFPPSTEYGKYCCLSDIRFRFYFLFLTILHFVEILKSTFIMLVISS